MRISPSPGDSWLNRKMKRNPKQITHHDTQNNVLGNESDVAGRSNVDSEAERVPVKSADDGLASLLERRNGLLEVLLC